MKEGDQEEQLEDEALSHFGLLRLSRSMLSTEVGRFCPPAGALTE